MMHTPGHALSALCQRGDLIGKDLLIFDDNSYYRGRIEKASADQGLIVFVLKETRSVRFGTDEEEIEEPLSLPSYSCELGTTYRKPDGDVIQFDLSLSGTAHILLLGAPIPLFA